MLLVQRLSASYGGRRVLNEVDLEVGGGEVVGLVGPNGCGKTTLLKAVTSSLKSSGGRVELDGKDVSQMTARELARNVAVVPQNARLPAGYSARDVVLMGRTAHLGFLEQEGVRDQRLADSALRVLQAEELGQRDMEEMSGGERQNVVIARALAQETPLILLDEPTANLDIGHQIAIATLMRRLAGDEGKAILMALHDLTLASVYCDRLLLMRAGKVLAQGRPAEVLRSENIAAAYGVNVAMVRPEGLDGPVILPIVPDGES